MISDELLERAIAFHGHLGPFLVLGLRMGLLAMEFLSPKDLHSLKANVKTRLKTPFSCLIDGIQISSFCTLGKNNLNIEDSDILEAIFESKSNKIKITVKDEVIRNIISQKLKRNSPEMIAFSNKIRNIKDSGLFIIKKYE